MVRILITITKTNVSQNMLFGPNNGEGRTITIDSSGTPQAAVNEAYETMRLISRHEGDRTLKIELKNQDD